MVIDDVEVGDLLDEGAVAIIDDIEHIPQAKSPANWLDRLLVDRNRLRVAEPGAEGRFHPADVMRAIDVVRSQSPQAA